MTDQRHITAMVGTHISLPPALKKTLYSIAKREGISLAEIIRRGLSQFVEEEGTHISLPPALKKKLYSMAKKEGISLVGIIRQGLSEFVKESK